MRVVADVVEHSTLRNLNLFRIVVEVYKVDTIPGFEEWNARNKLEACLSLHDLVLVKNLLIVLLRQAQGNDLAVSEHS